MSYSPDAFRAIVRVVLQQMDARHPGMWSRSAEELLMLTSAHESHLGRWLTQQGGGVALGVYQQQPADLLDCYRYLERRTDIAETVLMVTGHDKPSLIALQYDPVYSTAMARVHYWMVPRSLPSVHDTYALAEYWDKNWNRNPLKGFPQIALEDYKRLVST